MPCTFRFTNLWTCYLGHPVFRCTKNHYGPIKTPTYFLRLRPNSWSLFFFLYRISIVINKKPILTFNGNICFGVPWAQQRFFLSVWLFNEQCSSVFSARGKTTQLISMKFVKNIHTRWSQTPAYNGQGG